jgi:hypothetical protein
MKKSEQQASDAQRIRNERRQYWTGQVQRWKESGLTQKEYCINEDISLERFGTWKRRLDRETQIEMTRLVPVPAKTVSSALFIARPVLGLVVDSRYRVEIPDAFSPSTLEAVLQVISRV